MKDIAVITGAGGGIGRAVAKALAKNYDVVGLSRKPFDDMNFIDNISCDVTDKEQVSEAFGYIIRSYNEPKILINCAGYVNPKPIIETTPEEWEEQIQTNLTGAFLCTKAFLKYNLFKGKIINIASTAGTRPSPNHASYGAAKAGLINFSQSLSEELFSYGIKVYCLVPGRCATDLRRKLAPDEDMTKIMQPEEVADFVATLVDNDYPVDGNPIVVRRQKK